MSEKKTNSSGQIIAAIIGATAVCIAAMIGLLQPVVNHWVDNLPTNTPSISGTAILETPIPTFTSLASVDIVTEIPTSIPTILPAPTKIPINTLTRLEILSLFEIPRNTNRSDIDRLDTVFRPSLPVICRTIIIPNYPLLPKYTLDDYGNLYEYGQSSLLSPPLGEILNVDVGKWENYLGVFDFVVPADKNLQFYGLYIRSEGGGLNWQDSQRFIYSADVLSGFEIERASYVEIQDCSDSPNSDWAKENAQRASASSTTDSVYYWDKSSNAWVQLK